MKEGGPFVVCTCLQCGKRFKKTARAYRKAQRKSGRHFCSSPCFGKYSRIPGSRQPWVKRGCRQCGAQFKVWPYQVRDGHGAFCSLPCARRGRAVIHGGARRGVRRSLEYGVWAGMRDRCNNPRHESYGHYGGRGITVCDRWASFASFLSDMGPRPSLRHSIDRIDNDGNYEPGNCRWATDPTQRRNKRSTVLLRCGTVTQCVADWAHDLGVPGQSLRHAYERRGELAILERVT